MDLHNLKPAEGSKHDNYRRGGQRQDCRLWPQGSEGKERSSQTRIRRRPDASVQKTPQERLHML